MARYKDYSYDQHKLLPIAFREQILPGTFEYTLNYLMDHEVDLSVFEARYRNDETGAPAYDPAILLKIILYAYARGVISSREIERCCRENVIFMALSADTQPHFSTIAGFISSMSEEIPVVFRDVLLYCDEMGLIGKELFAVDGCKLPSNASKEWSGTRAEFEKKKQKMEGAICSSGIGKGIKAMTISRWLSGKKSSSRRYGRKLGKLSVGLTTTMTSPVRVGSLGRATSPITRARR